MKILFLHKQILFPRDTGGKIRVLNVLKHLGHRHSITYVCNLRAGEECWLPEMSALGLRVEPVNGETSRRGSIKFYFDAVWNLASSRPFSINRNYDPALRARIAELLAVESYDVVICDTVQMALHLVGLKTPAKILFQ